VHGDSVRVLVLPESVQKLRYHDRIDVIIGSLEDDEALQKAVEGVEVVYHFAQRALGARHNPRAFHEVNVFGLENLLRASVPSISRFVFMSSVQVYSPQPNPNMWPITEGYPRMAHGSPDQEKYGQSMIDAEDLILRFHRRHKFAYVILRPTVIYGPGAEFVEELLWEIINAPQLASCRTRHWGPMQWLHVADLAEAAVQAGTLPEVANRAFNLAGDESVTLEKITEILQELAHGSLGREHHRRYRYRTRFPLKFDTTAAREQLRFDPKVRLWDGLGQMLAHVTKVPKVA